MREAAMSMPLINRDTLDAVRQSDFEERGEERKSVVVT